MKKLGIVFIIIGLSLLGFVIYSLLNDNNHVISPIPENKGVRVIFVTPTTD